jgi:hypothetical protein
MSIPHLFRSFLTFSVRFSDTQASRNSADTLQYPLLTFYWISDLRNNRFGAQVRGILVSVYFTPF